MKKSVHSFLLTTLLLFGSTSYTTANASPSSRSKAYDTTITAGKTYQTRSVEVEAFNAITASSAIDVVYTQAEGGPTVEIYAPRQHH